MDTTVLCCPNFALCVLMRSPSRTRGQMAALAKSWRERKGVDREIGGLDSEQFRPAPRTCLRWCGRLRGQVYPPSNEQGARHGREDSSDAELDFRHSGDGVVFDPAFSPHAAVGLHSGLSPAGMNSGRTSERERTPRSVPHCVTEEDGPLQRFVYPRRFQNNSGPPQGPCRSFRGSLSLR
jgi:hypothetical protein